MVWLPMIKWHRNVYQSMYNFQKWTEFILYGSLALLKATVVYWCSNCKFHKYEKDNKGKDDGFRLCKQWCWSTNWNCFWCNCNSWDFYKLWDNLCVVPIKLHNASQLKFYVNWKKISLQTLKCLACLIFNHNLIIVNEIKFEWNLPDRHVHLTQNIVELLFSCTRQNNIKLKLTNEPWRSKIDLFKSTTLCFLILILNYLYILVSIYTCSYP